MAEWVTLLSKSYSGWHNYSGIKTYLQYDKESASFTELTIRFASRAVTGSGSSDVYVIWSADGEIARIAWANASQHKTTLVREEILDDDGKTKVSCYVGNTITITKRSDSPSFNIPEFWLCNDGNYLYIMSDTIHREHSDYTTGDRQPIKTIINSGGTEFYWRSPGNVGTLDGIENSENNSAHLWGTIGGPGYNNNFREAIIHYTLDGFDPKSSKNVKQKIIVQRTAEDILLGRDYPSSYDTYIPVTKDCTIKAYLEGKFDYNTTESSTKTASILYHTNMTGTPVLPSVVIADNDDNTFTILTVGCNNGKHNNVVTTGCWGYSTKYEKGSDPDKGLSFTETLEIVDSTKDTRRVYAKVTSIPGWEYDSNYRNGAGISKTTSLPITQYVAPSKPGIPDLAVTKSRVTIKEPWTITWDPAEAVNKSSPVKGYYIMVLRKAAGSSSFEYVRELRALTGNYIAISKGSNSDDNTNYFIKRPGASCTAIISDPASLGFVPGDEVVFRIKSYTENATGKVWQLEGQAGASDSRSYQIRNAGIVHVNVPESDTSVEGQVWIKAEGEWHEAESVCVKDEGIWHESQ